MSGWNTRDVEFTPGEPLQKGYVLRNKLTGLYVFRPDRGSGGYAIWTDPKRAERECDENEEVVPVELHMKVKK